VNDPISQEPPLIHRLRNHLAVVVSFAELLLLDMPPDAPQRADVLEIKKAAMAAMALIPDVTSLVSPQDRQ
jgi:hypothetical protein